MWRRLLGNDAILVRAFTYFQGYWLQIAVAFVLLVLSTLIGLIFPIITRYTIDVVLPSHNVRMLWILAGLCVLAPITGTIMGAIQGYMCARIGLRVAMNLRSELLENLLYWPLRRWDTVKTGDLNSRVIVDTQMIQNLVMETLPSLARNLLLVPSALIMLLALDPKLTVACMLFIPLYVLPAVFFGPHTRNAWRNVADRRSDLMRDVQESLLGHRVVKSLVRERFQLEQLKRPQEVYVHAHLAAGIVGRAYNLVIQSAGALVPALLLVYGGLRVMAGETSIGTLVAFVTYLQQMYGAVSSIPSLYVQTKRHTAHLERVFEYLDLDIESYEGKTVPVITGREKQVVFDDVWMAYEGKKEVLRGVSFTIEDGQIAALVGPSGCGKTTAASLVAGLYQPERGQVYVGPYRLDQVDLRELRRYVGLVAQDTFLFNTSIMENIRFGREGASDDDVRTAARIARVDEFALQFPEGFDTIVGERGVKLSGGQRQRISIARTVLQNPPVLLLDEATSSLDPATEAEVQEALIALMQGRTCLIITHRLSTVMNASKIMVMKDGVIVDEGSHDELTRLSSTYQDMLMRQGQGVKM